MNSHVSGNRNESWTDEKHVNFLNSVEAWFVRTMLENNDRYNLRLDRQLPDSSESTLDCKHHSHVPTTKKHASSAGTTRTKMKVKTDRRSTRPPPPPQSPPRDSSEDQVVPQIQNRTEDKD